MAINNNTINKNIIEEYEIIGHPSDLVSTLTGNTTAHPKIDFTWNDPEIEGVPYGGTRLVIKEKSIPKNENDGIVIVDTMDKNKYQEQPYTYTIPNEVPGDKNFFATLFPYSSSGIMNTLKKCVTNINVSIAAIRKKFMAKGSSVPITTNFNFTTTDFTYGDMYDGKYYVAVRDKTDNAICSLVSVDSNMDVNVVVDIPHNDIPDFSKWPYAPVCCTLGDSLYIVLCNTFLTGTSSYSFAIYKYNTISGLELLNLTSSYSVANVYTLFTLNNELYMYSYIGSFRGIVSINKYNGQINNVFPISTNWGTSIMKKHNDTSIGFFRVLSNKLREMKLELDANGEFISYESIAYTVNTSIGRTEMGVFDDKILVMSSTYILMDFVLDTQITTQICDTKMASYSFRFIQFDKNTMVVLSGNSSTVVSASVYDYIEY